MEVNHRNNKLSFNLLCSLVSEGVVQEVTERGVKRFSAIAPAQLQERIEQKRTELSKLAVDVNNAIRDIEALIPKQRNIPRVRMFRGASGVKELYQLTLTSKEKLIRAYADFGTLFPREKDTELNAWLWDYAQRRARKGILYRGIVTRSADSDTAFRKRKAQKRDLRLLEGQALPVEINIFDHFVAIASTSSEMMGILIESEPISLTARHIFDALWVKLSPYSIGGC